jgi:hypothetical protein
VISIAVGWSLVQEEWRTNGTFTSLASVEEVLSVSDWLKELVFKLVLVSDVTSLLPQSSNAVISGVGWVHIVWILSNGDTHWVLWNWWFFSLWHREPLC